jgi:hypothetical protein
MPIQTCSFSFEHLGGVLRESRTSRRFLRFRDFSDGTPANMVCLLRHDVDVSLEYAARMAHLEQELGIPATYFVRMRAAGYNPMSRRGRAILTDLENGGGEVGLHYEGAGSEENPDSARRRFLLEMAMLEDLLGHPVGVALHMPKRCTGFDSHAIKEAGALYDVASQERFGALSFMSDSSRKWRNGCICEHLCAQAGLHILLHPVWWMPEVREADSGEIVRRLAEGD